MLTLYIQAPFAVFRPFGAGVYRPTASFLTPSATYGLLLNIAGVPLKEADTEIIRDDIPPARVALGAVPGPAGSAPVRQSVYQQLHTYSPSFKSGDPKVKRCFGNKYHVQPARREYLSDLRACVCLDCPDLEALVRRGLETGETADGVRCGLPYLGDNSFLPDRIDVLDEVPEAHWFYRVDGGGAVTGDVVRLSAWVEPLAPQRAVSYLYRPLDRPSAKIPENAWTDVGPQPVAA